MFESNNISEDVSMRILRPSDAAALAVAYVRNLDYLAPWEPVRPEEYYTEAWQAADIAARLAATPGADWRQLRPGFQQLGVAPRYLLIAGNWQDHNLYQILLQLRQGPGHLDEDWAPAAAGHIGALKSTGGPTGCRQPACSPAGPAWAVYMASPQSAMSAPARKLSS